MSPFEADLGYQPVTPARWQQVKESKAWKDTTNTLSKEFLEHQQDVLAKARRSLQASQDRMSSFYDKNRPVQQFQTGDRVLLSTNNLATFHAGTTKKKLGPKWIGPYAISEKVGHDYYRLELPTRVKFHPVFHTSMLKPYIQSNRSEQTIFKVRLPDGSEGELVEDIVDFRRRKGKDEYKVKWIGQAQLTWEPLENLQYVLDLVHRYHERQATKPKQHKRKQV